MSERRKPGEEVGSVPERPNAAGARVVRIDAWPRKQRRHQPVEPDDDTSGPDPGPSAA